MTGSAGSEEELLRRFDEAARGLLFPSESDFPFTSFRWGGEVLSPEALRIAEGFPIEAPVEVVTPEDFFGPVIAPGEGSEPELVEAERYRRLLGLLRAELQDLRVYRVGRVTIEVYILGRSACGPWLGLKTKVVES